MKPRHRAEHRFDPQHRDTLMGADRWQRWNPPSLLALAGLGAGQTALDLGCGPGFWTLPMAEMVGALGNVFALDVSQEMLESLFDKNSHANIHAMQVELPHIPLADASVHFIWAAFVFHEVEPPAVLALQLRRVFQPGGRMAVLEWQSEAHSGNGPPLRHRVSPQQLESFLSEAGFNRIEVPWQDEEAYLLCAE